MLGYSLKCGVGRKLKPNLIILFADFLLGKQRLVIIGYLQGSLLDPLNKTFSNARLIFPRRLKVSVFVIVCHQQNYNQNKTSSKLSCLYQKNYYGVTIHFFLSFETPLNIQFKMAKKTFYFANPHHKLNQLLNQMSQNQIDNTNKHLKELLNKKKAKLKQIYSLTSHQVIQPKMLPIKHSSGSFMEHVPMAVVQEFTDQKIKANILKPDRFYASQPNVKAGSFMLPKRASLAQNRTIVKAEFEEYNRIMNEQSGQYKHKKILKLLSLHEEIKGKPKYSRMKKTLFQKFIPDKYNLYENPICFKKSTTFESSILKKSLSKHLKSEDSLDNSDVKHQLSSSKQIRTIDLQQSIQGRRSRKISIVQRSRLKTNSIRQDETSQKNINNL